MKTIRYLLNILVFFSFFNLTHGNELIGPSESANGAFTVSWANPPAKLGCSEATVIASSNTSYEDIFPIDVKRTSFEFFGLPDGSYTISLTGICGNGKSTLIAARSVLVGSSAIETVSKNAIKSLSPSVSLSQPAASNPTVFSVYPDIGVRCGTYCPPGTHVDTGYCSAQVPANTWSGFMACDYYHDELTGCLYEPAQANSVNCQRNTTEFWTCGFTCPIGYNKTNQISGSSRCKRGFGGNESYCVLNTSPPGSVKLEGSITRYDAQVHVSWASVKHASYYQWKLSTDSSWTRTTGRTATVSNLSNGSYRVEARACNEFGCGPISSRALFLESPLAPVISSPSTNSAETYRLTWLESSGASRYEWRVNSGNWNGTQGLAVSVNVSGLAGGTHTFTVRACNTTGCGSSKSKSVNFHGPAAPVITSPVKEVVTAYTLSWAASENAVYYEWRIAGGGWNNTSGASAAITLSFGSNAIDVRACNSFGCSTPSSITVNLGFLLTKVENNQPSNSACSVRSTGGGQGYQMFSITCPDGNLTVQHQFNTGGSWSCRSVSTQHSGYTVFGSCNYYSVYKH